MNPSDLPQFTAAQLQQMVQQLVEKEAKQNNQQTQQQPPQYQPLPQQQYYQQQQQQPTYHQSSPPQQQTSFNQFHQSHEPQPQTGGHYNPLQHEQQQHQQYYQQQQYQPYQQQTTTTSAPPPPPGRYSSSMPSNNNDKKNNVVNPTQVSLSEAATKKAMSNYTKKALMDFFGRRLPLEQPVPSNFARVYTDDEELQKEAEQFNNNNNNNNVNNNDSQHQQQQRRRPVLYFTHESMYQTSLVSIARECAKTRSDISVRVDALEAVILTAQLSGVGVRQCRPYSVALARYLCAANIYLSRSEPDLADSPDRMKEISLFVCYPHLDFVNTSDLSNPFARWPSLARWFTFVVSSLFVFHLIKLNLGFHFETNQVANVAASTSDDFVQPCMEQFGAQIKRVHPIVESVLGPLFQLNKSKNVMSISDTQYFTCNDFIRSCHHLFPDRRNNKTLSGTRREREREYDRTHSSSAAGGGGSVAPRNDASQWLGGHRNRADAERKASAFFGGADIRRLPQGNGLFKELVRHYASNPAAGRPSVTSDLGKRLERFRNNHPDVFVSAGSKKKMDSQGHHHDRSDNSNNNTSNNNSNAQQPQQQQQQQVQQPQLQEYNVATNNNNNTNNHPPPPPVQPQPQPQPQPQQVSAPAPPPAVEKNNNSVPPPPPVQPQPQPQQPTNITKKSEASAPKTEEQKRNDIMNAAIASLDL